MTDDGVARRVAELSSKSSAAPDPELAAAPLPVAKGLNRNVLIVLGAIVGITALIAVTYTSSTTSHSRGADTVAVEAPRPQRPAFLDIPPKMATVDSARVARPRTDSMRAGSDVARELAELHAVEARRHDGWARPYRSSQELPSRVRASDAEYQKALLAPLMFGSAAERRGVADAVFESADSAAISQQLSEYTPGSPQTSLTPGLDDRDRRERRSFLANARTTDRMVAGEGSSSGVLLAGTVISAELLTDVNSDLPGDIVAQVTRDVFDSRSQETLLIPKGSRLIGRYDDRVVTGQSRLLVAWTRLVLADGRSIALPGFQGADEQGASGIAGAVDQHIGQQFGDALLLSLLGAGVELSQPRVGVYGSPSVGAVAGGALGQELSGVALELVRRHADVPPTISVPLGSRFNVYVNRDLVLGRTG